MKPDYERDGVRLYCGDTLDIIPRLQAESVYAVITDPPYGIDFQSAWRTDRTQWMPKIANDEAPFIWFLYPSFRVAKQSSCVLCFCRWDVQQPFCDAIGWAGFDVKSQIIWDRESHGMGDLNGSPAPQHDVLWFGVKGDFHFHGKRPKSVIRSMRLGGAELTHPNEKPIDLMRSLVKDYSPPNGIVLDCFMGSGTTGEACVCEGRSFIGVEIDRVHFERAVARVDGAIERNRFLSPIKETQPELFG